MRADDKDIEKVEIKDTVVRVLMTVDYFVPAYVPLGNGQTLEQVIHEWFRRFSLSNHHATRDNCRIGNSEIILAIVPLPEEEESNGN